MNYKYTCLNPIADCGLENLPDGYVRTEKFEDADAVFVRSAKMDELTPGANLLAVARAGAGVNNIPHAEYAKKGIVVFNTPGANANGVKELVIAGMLLASRDIVGGIEWVKENAADPAVGKAAEKAKKAFAGTEIQGKRLGVIGLGAIGQKVANAAVCLGMEVFGYDPYMSVDAAWNLDHAVKHCKNVEAIYRACDYITIHVPALESTKGMINAEAIAMMKTGVIIINAARDALVNEKDVLEAIEAGKVRRYVSDFPNATTAGKKGCIVIPHLGASTAEAEDNCAVMAVKEMRDYLENGNIVNSVNYPACSLGPANKAGRVAICHKNVANMIGTFTSILGTAGVNIDAIANKSRGDFAYSLIDTDSPVPDDVVKALAASEAVIRVRIVR
ncbi:MAG: 3-phosphoglycerate dehydrogenase [Kiritimatiellae bacterium]|nr:3-phosphoglycerate dehydrogenase [Kiritimatiellia bacterium]MBQ3340666.1 3-phosphoglycerate dehydrogenase [Kiritimatiellia bacterium]